MQKLFDMVGNVQMANTQTSLPNDRINILQHVEQSVGFAAVDETVTACFREKLQQTCEASLAQLLQKEDQDEETARACLNCGLLLQQFGKLERASEV